MSLALRCGWRCRWRARWKRPTPRGILHRDLKPANILVTRLSLTMLAQSYAWRGRFAEAIPFAERAYRAAPWNSLPAGVLAGVLAWMGETARAEEIVRQMGDHPTPIWGRVEYHLLCSEIDAAADWYEKVIEESPRWPSLAKMMNLPGRPQALKLSLSERRDLVTKSGGVESPLGGAHAHHAPRTVSLERRS